MFRSVFTIMLVILCLCAMPLAAEQTPPIQPKVQETPLPVQVTLPAPPGLPDIPNTPLTASEAACIALNHQPNVTVAQAGVIAAAGRQQQARSELYPSLTTGAGYNNQAISPSATNGRVSSANASGYQVTANLSQLIFDFNHTRDLVRQSTALRTSAYANMTRVESDLVLQVKQAFYNYAQSIRLVSVNEANLRNQQSHLDVAKARLSAGLGLPADVVRAETAVSNAIFNLNVAHNNASVARINLAELMGIDPRTPVEISDTGEPAIAADDVNALVDTAMKQRPEMVQTAASAQAAAYGVNAAKTGNGPSLSANAGWLQRGSDFPPGENSLVYGLAIQWTPFDAGFTRGRVKEAQANLLAAQAQMQSARLAIVSDVSQAYINLKTAEQRLVTAESEVANAQEALRLTEGRYRAGLGTFIDVLDAQTALVTADTNRVNAKTAVDQARAALSRSIGAPIVTASAAVGQAK